MTTIQHSNTRKMVLGAVLTALVVVLQLMGSFVRFGPFSISLVLIPIVIGAATCGVGVGGWLGLVFGAVVLFSGDAGPFMAVNVGGTILTVLAKGIGCGVVSALAYKAFEKYNPYLAVIVAAVVCPLVNTGIFLLGCSLFFMETITAWAAAAGYGGDVARYAVVGLVGINFVAELGFNIVLSPVIVRLLHLANSQKS